MSENIDNFVIGLNNKIFGDIIRILILLDMKRGVR
jgi:hypothetical protein